MNTDKIYAEQIVNQYSKKSQSKVVALKKLDRRAKRPANIFGYVFGIIMSLIAGTGMSLSMHVIGDGSQLCMLVGIAVGVVGFIGMAVNYPIYSKILEKSKQKYAFEILQLAKEISEE